MASIKYKKTLLGLFVLALLVLATLVVYIERQNLYDQIALIGYHPSSDIQQLATEDGMTAYTKRVFYVNHPELYSKSTFSEVCPNNSEQNVVLGCYHSGQQGIFLLTVSDNQLAGLEQVTAAYETLHAIYQRLSLSDQAKLNSELIAFENNSLNDPVITAQIATFRITEPGDVLNEMTSLFGTEVQNLSPSLNTFYSKYFTNRQTIYNYYNNYESAFTSREKQIADLDAQLTSLNNQIKGDEASLYNQQTVLNREQTNIIALRNSGQIDQYNQQVDQYNQQVNQYNDLETTVTGLIKQYNQIVDEQNSIALQAKHLAQDITSTQKQSTL